MNVKEDGSDSRPPAGAAHPQHTRGGPPTHRSRLWCWLLFLIALALAIWFLKTQRGCTLLQPAGSGRASKTMPVPVGIATAVRGNMPVYLDGLGSVTALYTVTVQTRVDGQLMAIYYREGQQVHAGELIAEIDPRPFQVQLEQAEGQMAHDQALLANARLDLERYRTLATQEAIPKQLLDTQEAAVRQAEATIKTDQAAIDDAKLQLVYCRITAPISGVIGLRLVDPGNIVHISDTNGLLVITQVQPITVVFTLPEESLPAVLGKLRAGATLRVDAFNRDKSRKLASGRLLAVDNVIDQNTGTLRLKAEFENATNALFPNQFVNVRLLVEVRRNQVIVPTVAVQRGSQGTFLYVIKSGNTAEIRKVELGVTEGFQTSINSGLQAGENVVTDGSDKLRPGSLVMAKPEAPGPSSASK
jgi:multidrug efflux system membrane fusion protein